MKLATSLCSILLLLSLGAAPAASLGAASDSWNQWRGPARDARALDFGQRSEWPTEAETVWEVEVGLGHASPVTEGERVCVHSRVGDEEVAACYGLSDGEEQWSSRYPVAFKAAMGGRSHGAGPKATPFLDRGRFVTFGITSVLTAYDSETGELLWRRDFEAELGEEAGEAWPRWGTSYSPLPLDGDVIAQFGRAAGALVRIDGETGETVWAIEGDGSAYSSPIIIVRDGVQQIVSASSKELLGVSFDGEVLWRTEHPSTLMHQGIATPLVAGELLVVSTGNKPLRALELDDSDGRWSTRDVWQRDDITLEMGSLVAVDDRVCGLWKRRKGQAFCLSASDGTTLWESAPRFGEHASILVVPGALLYQLPEAELVALDSDSDSFVELGRVKVADSEVWAHPAPLAGGRLLVKSHDRLALLSLE